MLGRMLTSGLIQYWRNYDNRSYAEDDYGLRRRIREFTIACVRNMWAVRRPDRDGYSLSLYGVYLKERKQDATFEFCKNGGYGTFLLNTLELIREDYVFLDVGGNIGLYSLIAGKNPHIKGIHIFEPDPVTLPYLRANIEYNNLSRVKVHPFALSNSAGVRDFYSKENHSGVSSLQDHALGHQSAASVESVATPYLESNVPVPQGLKVFAKIDVEGHEYFAMESLFAWSHAAEIDQIFIEFDTWMSNVEDLEDLLKRNSFHEVRRTGSATHWDALWSK